jgi:SAM-dependent methyltransferase
MRFDRKAAQYHEKADIQKLVADWCGDWIERDCQDKKAVELGAGTGLLTRHLALRGFESFAATDLSERMLEQGRARLPMVDWKRLDAWSCDVQEVDRLYASSLLQWAPDPLEVLKNWRAALKPEGRVLTSFFAKGSLKEFVKRRSEFSAIPWRRKKDWLRLFEEAGFQVLRIDSRRDLISYESAREALRAIHDMGAVTDRRMGVGELRRFLKECDAATEGSFELSWRALRVECVKV